MPCVIVTSVYPNFLSVKSLRSTHSAVSLLCSQASSLLLTCPTSCRQFWTSLNASPKPPLLDNNGQQQDPGSPYAGSPYAGSPYAGSPYAGSPYARKPVCRKPVCPSSAQKTFVHAPGLRLRRTANKLTKSFAGRIAFPITQQGLHSRTVISELNTEPARSSVNA